MKQLISFIILSIFVIFPSSAQTLTEEQKTLRQEIYDYLKTNGYNPEIDDDGEIKFINDDLNYYITIYEKDTNPMYLTMFLSFTYSDEFSKENITKYANEVNLYKGVKILPFSNSYSIGADMYLIKSSSFTNGFSRLLSTIGSARNELRELVAKEDTDSSDATPVNNTPVSTDPSAEIKEITTEQNVYQNGAKGMNIHLKCTIKNLKNRSGSCNAYFYTLDGTALKDTNGKYNTVSGKVCAIKAYTPPTQITDYTDICIFVPYNELHQGTGTHTLKYFISVFDDKGNELAQSNWIEFTYTR